MPLQRYLLTWLAAFLLPACAVFGQRPNVIFVVVDDLNDYAFVDGHPESAVPNIARLADRGTRFNNAYCSSPLCAPSRISFMSGKDIPYTQITGNPKVFEFRDHFTAAKGNETVFTLPEVLKDSGGYYTIGINKLFHNFYRPDYDNDFDSSSTDPCARGKSWSEYVLSPELPGVTPVNDGFGPYSWGKVPNDQEPLLSDYRATTAAIKFLNDYATDKGQFCDRPFFMALGLIKPHTPQFVPEKYFPDDYVDDVYAVPFDVPYNEPFNSFPPNGFFVPPQATPQGADYAALGPVGKSLAQEYLNRHKLFEQYGNNLSPLPLMDPSWTDSLRREVLKNTKRANAAMGYWAAVRYIDAQLGRILDFLDEVPDVRDSTIIVFISDHGYSLGEKTHWQKQALWETDVRVPLIIVDPRRPGGQVSRRTASLLDVFPTLLDATGTPPPAFPDGIPYLDGRSLVPLLDQPDAPWERPVLSTVSVPEGSVTDGGCFEHHSVHAERWHYIRYYSDGGPTCDEASSTLEEELYEIGPDRDVDPFEWNNLAGSNSYKPVIDYLAEWLPDGSRYGQLTYRIELQTEQLPCRLTRTDTLQLSSKLWAPDGQAMSDPLPGTRVMYRILPFGRKFTGNDLNVPLTVLDSTQFANLDELEIQVALWANGTGVLTLDSRKIAINGGQVPNATFNVVQNGPFLTVDSLQVSGSPLASWWTFGDGVRSDDYWQPGYDGYYESAPPAHRYIFPGAYDLTLHLSYGTPPGAVCENQVTVPIDVPDSLFDGQPCQQPGLVRLETVSQDGTALARWSPVYADDRYTLRFRNSSPPDGPWQYRNSNVPTLLLDSLEAGFEYTFSVRAICDTTRTSTDTSEWSYPFRQRALRCDHPEGFALAEASPTSVLLRWDGKTGVAGFEIAYRETGGPFINVDLGPQAESLLILDLNPGSDYGASIRTKCTQIFTEEPIPGAFSPPLSWITPISRQALPEENQMAKAFQIMPNPSQGMVELSGLQPGSQWRVFDMAGRNVAHGLAASSKRLLDLRALPAGTYLIMVQHGGHTAVRHWVRMP